MTRSGLADPRQALMEAAGDPRDWFRYGHRLRAYERAWAEFMDARRRRFDTGLAGIRSSCSATMGQARPAWQSRWPSTGRR